MESRNEIWNNITDGFSDFIQMLQQNCPGGLLGCVGLSVTSLLTANYIYNWRLSSKTKDKIKKRQAQAAATINKIRKMLDECKQKIDVSITEIPFSELQAKLKNGQLTCQQVLLAYQSKAVEVHDRTNCITEFLISAQERARQLDALKPEERGMLHGIPMSVKETVGIAGEDCTAGMSYFIDQIHEDNGTIIKMLLKQGVIPFVRTNICQAQLSLSCSNPIYGVTGNPWNPKRTCGGSSGGEGALLGGHGSIFGMGCDMGGSNRVPAHFCGACGFKPTSERMSNHGNLPHGHGIVIVREVYGPMGRDVASAVAFLKAALEPELFQLDPLIPQIPWREEIFNSKKPLKIGFYIGGIGMEPVPAVKRAVLMAKASLEKMGHKVVEFNPPDAVEAIMKFMIETLMGDDGKYFGDYMKHDTLDPSYSKVQDVSSVPYTVRRIISKLLFFLDPVESAMLAGKPCSKVSDWWVRNDQREAYRRKFIDEMYKKDIEAIICPTLPVPAWPKDDDFHSMSLGTYTMLYNLLDFPCGVVPVTHVMEEDIKKMSTYPKRDLTEKFMHRISEGSENLPISVQCVSLPFREEIALRLMKEVETGVKNM